MIPKSGNRFSERSCPTKQITDESDSTQLNQTLNEPAGIASSLKAEMRRRPPRAIGGSGGSRAGPSFAGSQKKRRTVPTLLMAIQGNEIGYPQLSRTLAPLVIEVSRPRRMLTPLHQ